jgi:hypothetical protein
MIDRASSSIAARIFQELALRSRSDAAQLDRSFAECAMLRQSGNKCASL